MDLDANHVAQTRLTLVRFPLYHHIVIAEQPEIEQNNVLSSGETRI